MTLSLLAPPASSEAIMFRVNAALVPCIATATVAFGALTLAHCALALVAGALVEGCARAARGLPLRVFADGAAPVTCLL
ncbi:MAG: hypothetical protein OXS50_06145, partial [Gammaproteobacteria bacterium]|nr:hypothetical protein [Gammaproteobacteria bacterium]